MLVVVLIGLFVLSGCTKVGKYKEGTYFAADEASGYTAVVYVDKAGEIKSVFIDAPYIQYDNNNKCPSVVKYGKTQCVPTTKQTLGNDYGMRAASPIKKEWYEQAQAFADKVIAEQDLAWLELKYKDSDGKITATQPTGKTEADKKYTDSVAGVTMTADNLYRLMADIMNQAKK
jgi:uncharacterized protein YceK